MNNEIIANIPKTELHVHLDGALSPSLTLELAKKNGITIDPSIFNHDKTQFTWTNFSTFHHVFEASFKCIQTPDDFYTLLFSYLKTLAEQNTIYTEIIVSPYHAFQNQLTYQDMLESMVRAIDDAREQFHIEARLLMVFLKHYGPKQALEIARQVTHERHPYVVGVNLVGDIKQHEIKEFTAVFDHAQKHNLGLTCHAGEIDGPPSEVWQAIDDLGVTRVSHGINAMHDERLMNYLFEKKILCEICPTSNVVLKMFPDYASHPLRLFFDRNIPLCLNTDDPAFFNTTLTQEYLIAHQYHHFTLSDLSKTVIDSIRYAFIDDNLKQALINKVTRYEEKHCSIPGNI